MTTIDITCKDKTTSYRIPSEWDELTRRQLIIFMMTMQQRIHPADVRKTVLFRWMKIKPFIFFNTPVHIINEMEEQLDWLFSEKLQGSKCIIPTYDHHLRRWYGPGNYFEFLTVEEFALCEQLIIAYQENKSLETLKKLFVVMYRRATADSRDAFYERGNDPRPLISEHIIPKNVAMISAIPPFVLKAVWLNFCAYHQYVVAMNESLFKKKSDNPGMGWAGIIHSLAGPELGTINQVAQMPFNNCLFIMRKLDQDRIYLEKTLNNV